MRRISWTKIAVAASVLVSGAIIASPAPSALAAAPPPPPVINMSNIPSQYAGAVQTFENNAVSEVLTDHNLPASDANAVLGWGRDDVRAQEWSDLAALISEPATSRSANDQLVYSWFQGVMQKQQIAAAQDAVNEYLKWSGHTSISDGSSPMNFGPNGTGYCNYEPPGGESGPFGGTYNDNQDQDCYTPCTDFVTDCTPAFPSVDQFQQWGLYDADQQQTNTPDYYSTMVGTSVSMGVGLTAALGSLALPFGTAIDASALGSTALQEAIFPFAARVGYWAAQAARLGLTGADIASDVAPEAAAGAELAGAIAFVAGIAIFFIISTVLASITLAQNAAVHSDLADALTQAQNNPPDLASQVGDTNGYAAMYSTFVEATLPEADASCTNQDLAGSTLCANAPAPAAPASTDPAFLVTANGTTTLQRSIYSVDPGGYFDNTYLSGNGWFVTQRFDQTDAANATSPADGGATLQSLSFPYTDWSGNHYVAERVTVGDQPMFAVTPVDSSNESACNTPNGGTGTPCLTSSLQFQEPNGTGTPVDATAQLEPASALAPTAAASFPSSITAGQPVTLTAIGSDPNNSALSYTWKLPSQWNNNSISCPGSGPCDATLTGATPAYTFTLPGVYDGTLTVTDAAGFSSTENFAVTVTGPTTTTISSSANPSAYGQPVTLTADVAPTLVGGNQAGFYPRVFGWVQFTLNDQPLGQPVALQSPAPGCSLSACQSPDGFATLTLPTLPATPAGLHGQDITARFLGSSQYAASSEFLVPNGQVINQASTLTTVSSSADPSVPGQPITFTASVAPVAPGAGLPTGKVQFQLNGVNVGGPMPLDSAGTATSPPVTPAHATQDGPVLGPNLTAVYSGDNNFATSSDGLYQNVDTDPTTTTVTSSANPSGYRQPVTFTAAVVANAPGSGTPTGQVQFSIDGSPAGSPVNLDANGTATLTTDATDTLAVTGAGTSFPTGHAISAQYLGVPCAGCFFFVPDFGQSTGILNQGSEGQDVGPAQLTITASSPTVTYGDPAPVITAGYAGFVAGDTAASLTTAPACVTTYQQGNGAGSYLASCQGAVDPDYQIGYAAGAVTVNQAMLTVTAKNASMTAGGSPPAYGFSLSGFIGSDGPSALSAQPTCVADDPATGNPVSASTPGGTYPITCSGAAAANYAFSYVAGTLTVSRNATSLLYTGGQTVVGGSSFTAQALVSSAAAAAVCTAGQPVVFSLDRNPLTGATGTYPVGTATTAASAAAASVATTGWRAGVYVITAAAQANGPCGSSTATATLTVGAAGKAAAGVGSYTAPGAGKATFSLVAAAVPHSSPPAATGVLTWSTSQWQLAATVSHYVITGNAGSVTGTGLLYWWNPALNKGKGGWQLAKSGVAFTASFTGTVLGKNANATPGTFGINIAYSPVAPQAVLPNSAPQSLSGGAVGGS